MIADRGPIGAANHADVLDGQDGKEQVLVGPIVPILIHLDEFAS